MSFLTYLNAADVEVCLLGYSEDTKRGVQTLVSTLEIHSTGNQIHLSFPIHQPQLPIAHFKQNS